jgi:glycosyltransferase involved in cell wall biosynthesis
MKVAIIGTVGIPANYGGFETLAENLVEKRQDAGIEYTVFCSSKAYSEKLHRYKGATLKYVPVGANGWQSVIYDNISLMRAYFSADVVLSLGGSNILHPLLKLFKKTPVINNFDGMDSGREKWGRLARRAIRVISGITARYSDVCICDNEVCQEYFREKYGRDSCLIEYGGDNAVPVRDDARLKAEFGLEPGGYSFKVARIEPENNIEMILDAFSRMPAERFVIVGNWNKSLFGREMKSRYGGFPNIDILDPIYDPVRLNLLRSNCKWYIHGHSAGGTNPSLVEAMSLGLPVIAYDVPYNVATTEGGALYFQDAASLTALLQTDGDSRKAIAAKMKEIADRRYRWETICAKYEQLYKLKVES